MYKPSLESVYPIHAVRSKLKLPSHCLKSNIRMSMITLKILKLMD